MVVQPTLTDADYRDYILRLLERQPPAEVWPAAAHFLGVAEAERLCGPRPPKPKSTTINRARIESSSPIPQRSTVGTHLHAVIAEMGVSAEGCFNCQGHILRANAWTVDECRDRRAEIAGWLVEGRARLTWWETARTSARALAKGYTSAESLVDEALRRAEAK